MALNAILKFGTRLTKEKQNKTKPLPHLAKELGQTKQEREKERNFEKQEKQDLFSHFLSKLSAFTHLTQPKSEITSKEGEKARRREEERRRKEEGRPSKPSNLQNHHQNKSNPCINSIIKVGVSKPRI